MVSGTERAKRLARRRVAQREPRTVIRVHTEGEVTELEYLRLVKGPDVRIDFGTPGFDPRSLVRHARDDARADRRRRSADRDFDQIWCVFDRDEHEDIDGAIQEARDAGVEIALSNPCVELWLLLHAEDQTASIHRGAAQKRCAELGLTEGKSIPRSAEEKLRTGYEDAKGRAQALGDAHEESGAPSWANPSSGLWRLVDRLRRTQADGGG